jgi:hypothetical protein
MRRMLLGTAQTLGVAWAVVACESAGENVENAKEFAPQGAELDHLRDFFHEDAPIDVHYTVRDASSRVELKRRAKLSYDFVYTTEKGERRVLASPTAERPINALVDARSHGKTTIACVNSFANVQGALPQVECFLLDSKSGMVLDKLVVADAWLRTTSANAPVVYLSPHGPINYEQDFGFACRPLYADDDMHLVYDAETRVPCEDQTVLVAPVRTVGLGTHPEAEMVRMRETMASKLGVAPETLRGMEARQPRTDMPDIRRLALAPGGGGTSGGGSGGDDTLEPQTELGNCGDFPESALNKRYLGPSDSSAYNQLLQGIINNLNVSRLVPDAFYEGGSLGFGLTAKLDGYTEKDAPLCLEERTKLDYQAILDISLGPVQAQGSVGWKQNLESCSELTCGDTKAWSCGGPRGFNRDQQLSLGFRLGGQIPLDKLPPLRAFCMSNYTPDPKKPGSNGSEPPSDPNHPNNPSPGNGGNDRPSWWKYWTAKIPKMGIACQLEISGTGEARWQEGEEHGKGQCGSRCPDQRQTSKNISYLGGGITGAIEIEAAFGFLFNGRAGIEAKWSTGVEKKDELACNGEVHTETQCTKFVVEAYLFGSAGSMFVFPNVRNTIYYSASEGCPVDDVPTRNPSSGHMYGAYCVNTSQTFALQQCLTLLRDVVLRARVRVRADA